MLSRTSGGWHKVVRVTKAKLFARDWAVFSELEGVSKRSTTGCSGSDRRIVFIPSEIVLHVSSGWFPYTSLHNSHSGTSSALVFTIYTLVTT